MKATIIAHGSITDFNLVRALISSQDIIIAADGGALHAKSMGIKPHILIGDMDSLGEEKAAEFKELGTEIIRFPKEKDETDTHLALLHALSLGAREITVIGAMGTRMDHTLGNLLLVFHRDFKHLNIVFRDEYQDITKLTNGIEIEGKPGETFSLIALEDIYGLNISGAKYPLVNAHAAFGGSLTLSNEFASERVNISWTSGKKILLVRVRQEE